MMNHTGRLLCLLLYKGELRKGFPLVSSGAAGSSCPAAALPAAALVPRRCAAACTRLAWRSAFGA